MSSEFKLPLSIEDIQRIIPHRYPFLFIDRVTEFIDREVIVAIKNVSINEPFFVGHFPGRPVMPGVIMVEALAQLGVLFAKMSTGGCPANRLLVFSGVTDFRFRKQVVPGDVLTLKLTEHKQRMRYWKMQGVVYVDGEVAADGVITATEVD